MFTEMIYVLGWVSFILLVIGMLVNMLYNGLKFIDWLKRDSDE